MKIISFIIPFIFLGCVSSSFESNSLVFLADVNNPEFKVNAQPLIEPDSLYCNSVHMEKIEGKYSAYFKTSNYQFGVTDLICTATLDGAQYSERLGIIIVYDCQDESTWVYTDSIDYVEFCQ